VHPESAGTYAVAARASTDGGATWSYGDLDGSANGYAPARAGSVVVAPATDREPPPPPSGLELVDVSGDHIALRWAPAGAADLYRYRVERATDPMGPFVATAEPGFIDTGVEAGTDYAYVVLAEDTSYNRSSPSAPLVATASDREVAVTFRVTVPDHTPGSDTIYLAGDFQGWDPGATPMTRVDATTWEISVPFEDGASPQYKYTRGSWEAVEKDAGCGEIPNRQLAVDFGAGGEQSISDTVAKWRDLDACG
jgi:hypothetical protein